MTETPPDHDSPARRGFLGLLTGGIGALVALVAAAPPLAMLLHPLLGKGDAGSDELWLAMGPLSRFPEGGPPIPVPINIERKDAWQTLPPASVGFAFVQRTGPEELRVLSGVCPHMGCAVNVVASGFACPCHRSRFQPNGDIAPSNDGKANPSPRGLDPLPYRVEAGQVEVQWVQYEPGTPERVVRG